MKTIDVIEGGFLTTVQDLGRFGYQRYGVPTSGALDLWSLRAANRLVGNADGAAGLELTLIGPRLAFLVPATIALTGADLGAQLDGREVPRWESVTVRAGAVLSFSGTREGVRAYLALAGGLDVPVVLGSRSTYARSKLGGYQGRPLRAGDTLHTPADRPVLLGGRRIVPPDVRPRYPHDHCLRVVLGPQDDRFTDEGRRVFLTSRYTVTPQSDRMGCRLTGPTIAHTSGPDLVSDGTPPGAVQVAGDGVPIVLLADRGTAGGYTKIATVVSADLSALAQAAPGDTVRFEAVTIPGAHELIREREAALSRISTGSAAPRRTRLKRVAAAVAAVTRVLEHGGSRG